MFLCLLMETVHTPFLKEAFPSSRILTPICGQVKWICYCKWCFVNKTCYHAPVICLTSFATLWVRHNGHPHLERTLRCWQVKQLAQGHVDGRAGSLLLASLIFNHTLCCPYILNFTAWSSHCLSINSTLYLHNKVFILNHKTVFFFWLPWGVNLGPHSC
jgi:hypothetical protein